MCSIELAVAGLNIANSINEYRSKQAIAEAQNKANEQTRRNSDQAYLYDINKIDNEKVLASREKMAEDFRLTQEKLRKQAHDINLGGGNSDKIIQDIAGAYDLQFLDVTRDYQADITRLGQKEYEAYAAQERRYNSIQDVAAPSQLGLLFKIGTEAASGYQKHVKAVDAGQSNVNDINLLSAIRTSTEGSR